MIVSDVKTDLNASNVFQTHFRGFMVAVLAIESRRFLSQIKVLVAIFVSVTSAQCPRFGAGWEYNFHIT